MVGLVNIAQNFTADFLFSGSLVGHHTLRSAEDGDAEAVENSGHFLVARVLAEAGTRYAFEAFDSIDTAHGIVFKGNLDDAGGGFTPYKIVV